MITIKEKTDAVYEIKKSEFLSFAFPVSSADEVQNILKEIRLKYSDARHVCYACVVSKPQMEKCSDDGEPDGTAGKPLLELIKKKGITNILLVVVRYFGGIKLGAGGLVRAYTRAGVLSLDKCVLQEIKTYKRFRVCSTLDEAKSTLNTLKSLPLEIENIEYSDKLLVVVRMEEKNVPELKTANIEIEEMREWKK